MTVKRLKVGESAPDVQVYNDSGQLAQSAQFWADGPILLTFLRHFG